ncbi:hypothetical protein C8Q80DRAFT_1109297, partial [Daedaleopsis nitida]
FWLSEGNVIFVAGRVKFRVHDGLLMAHSPVFSDMFKLANPSQVETTDGCKIVPMRETPDDIRHVLRALLLLRISPTINGYPNYETLSALVRFSHKYQIGGLLQQSLAYLHYHFTTDLDTWCASPSHVPDSFELVQAIGVVNLAYLTNTLSILPTALSVCCLLPGKDLIGGFKRTDGTRERLSEEDLAFIFDAKHHFMLTMTAATLRVFDQYVHSEWCDSKDECRRAACLVLFRLEAAPDLLASAHPFVPWEEYVRYFQGMDPDWKCPTVEMCSLCCEFREERFKMEQRKIWKDLPALFGLEIPGWK